jgi:hypothetical protein
MNKEELELMKTEETNFNERFRHDFAGTSALMGEDEESDLDQPMASAAIPFKGAQLASGNVDSEMHREMLL